MNWQLFFTGNAVHPDCGTLTLFTGAVLDMYLSLSKTRQCPPRFIP
jgi:hypothetical protein